MVQWDTIMDYYVFRRLISERRVREVKCVDVISYENIAWLPEPIAHLYPPILVRRCGPGVYAWCAQAAMYTCDS